MMAISAPETAVQIPASVKRSPLQEFLSVETARFPLRRRAMMAIEFPEMVAPHHAQLNRRFFECCAAAMVLSPRVKGAMTGMSPEEMDAIVRAIAKSRNNARQRINVPRASARRNLSVLPAQSLLTAQVGNALQRGSVPIRIWCGLLRLHAYAVTAHSSPPKRVTITTSALATVARHPAVWSVASAETASCSVRWMKSASH